MSIKFLVLGGGVFWVWGGGPPGGSADFIFMGARIFLIEGKWGGKLRGNVLQSASSKTTLEGSECGAGLCLAPLRKMIPEGPNLEKKQSRLNA